MSKRADGTNISNATELCKSWSSVRLHSKCGKKALGHFRQRMRVGPICIIKSLLGVLTVGGRGGRHGSREVVAVQSQGHWPCQCEKEQDLRCMLEVDS